VAAALIIRGPDLILPWASTVQEDLRFRNILRNGLIFFTICALAVPFLPVTEITREQQETLPPQLARVILDKQELPPPPPPQEKPKPKPKPKDKPKPKPKPEAKPKPKPVDLVKQAKQSASVAGLLAFQDDLADMRDSVDMDSLSKTNLSRGAAEAVKTERSIIATKAKSTSGGIKTAALSRDTGGSALSGKATTTVASPIDQIANQRSDNAASAEQGGRSDEAIRREMDKNKGAIFAIYNRALRNDPSLQGKYVFEMLITPEGNVSEVKLISSELGDPTLDRKILSRIRLIRFPAENVINTRVNYSFDFLPY
jgi:outer membrane biosynthesis protein TonB